jgi:hypothetical protein
MHFPKLNGSAGHCRLDVLLSILGVALNDNCHNVVGTCLSGQRQTEIKHVQLMSCSS